MLEMDSQIQIQVFTARTCIREYLNESNQNGILHGGIQRLQIVLYLHSFSRVTPTIKHSCSQALK
jgi:hypothetical protein